MDILSGLTLAAPAGLNAYIPLLALALAERFGWVHLRAPFDMIGSGWAIALIGVLLVVEVVADKVPAVDSVNDAVQTVVRPAAGGLVAMSASGEGAVEPFALLAAGIVIAGGVHATKATARPAVNVSTAGVGAPVVSTIEDILSAVGTVLALVVPILAAIVIVLAVIAVVIFVRRLHRRSRAATP